VVLPCLNEEATLAVCIEQVRKTFQAHSISGEVIVADNGSTDTSSKIAQRMGARVVLVESQGYGSALMGGINAAQGKYIVMGDADCSYDFSQIPVFLEKLRSGFELVMGNRFQGGIRPGAMSPLHKYFGNPLLTGIGRFFFKSPCGDFHCGLRGFTKAAYERMHLRTTGMEFASEMIVKASLFNLRVCEVPITLSPDGRNRKSHLRSWHDGWRHLRFLLLYSPRWLFFYPGLALLFAGFGAALWLLPGPRQIGHIFLDVHTLLYATVAILTGFQAVAFAFFTKVFAITEGLLPEDPRLTRAFRVFNLEKGLLAGTVLLAAGIGIAGGPRPSCGCRDGVDYVGRGNHSCQFLPEHSGAGAEMSVLGQFHEACIYGRRIRRLTELFVDLIPPNSSFLDVGCGDGKLARALLDKRPDLRIEGVDVLVRKEVWLPVQAFDGKNLPYREASFDGVMLIDVLHHAHDPLALLREALRVSRRWLIMKDHVRKGLAAGLRLRFMDYIGNAHHDVALPYNYLSEGQWEELRRTLDVKVAEEAKELGLYPKPFDYVFGADLHFVALWERPGPQ
jgi:glycosyltransferase involved in cell wall biosynthesis/SAM-dependent methyltransferase